MAFSLSHTYAPVLLEEVADADDVVTWVIMNTFGKSLQDIQMAYRRTRSSSSMVLVALSRLYTGRCRQMMLFAFIIAMT